MCIQLSSGKICKIKIHMATYHEVLKRCANDGQMESCFQIAKFCCLLTYLCTALEYLGAAIANLELLHIQKRNKLKPKI